VKVLRERVAACSRRVRGVFFRLPMLPAVCLLAALPAQALSHLPDGNSSRLVATATA
jgi:hypothetical protein